MLGTHSHWSTARVPWWTAVASVRAAWDVQANQGGLVSISGGRVSLSFGDSSTGHISVIGSTLTGISVRAHLLSTL